MTEQFRPAAVGFHGGELAAQQRAGVQAQAARLTRLVQRGELRSGMAAFLAGAQFAALTARDRNGRLWTSPLLGPPGFVRAAAPSRLRIDAATPGADPLHTLPAGQPVGLIVIDFAARRRVRINGVLSLADADGLEVDVEQAYGNCPQYIRQRRISVGELPSATLRIPLHHGDSLRQDDIRLIADADTFFLGTSHPAAGNDTSHRGGPAGFVAVTATGLWWPDYPGNNMFNSLGNLLVDPAAALLFIDFRAGAAVQLSGSAVVSWRRPGAGGDNDTGRGVEFTTVRVVSSAVPALGGAGRHADPDIRRSSVTDHERNQND